MPADVEIKTKGILTSINIDNMVSILVWRNRDSYDIQIQEGDADIQSVTSQHKGHQQLNLRLEPKDQVDVIFVGTQVHPITPP